MLTTGQIDRLVEALRQQGAPVVDRLAPGLTHRRMDELTGPLDIRVPDEARIWWGHYNGAPLRPGDGPLVPALSPSRWWAPLEAVVALCLEVRESIDPDMWLKSWLPVTVGGYDLVIETEVEPGQPSPVHVIDFEGDDEDVGEDHIPTLPSMGTLVDTWTRAVAGDAVRFVPNLGYFTIDFDRADALAIPDGLL